MTEKTCARCGDDWPADAEFFRVRGEGTDSKATTYMPWCRACEAEQKAEKRAAVAPAQSSVPLQSSVWSLAAC